METNTKKIKIIEKVLNILLDILIFMFGIVLLISLYIGIQTKIFRNDYANFFGYSLFEVQTGSMAPKINAGDWIVVKITKKAQLWSIITYQDSETGNFITHRVIQIYSDNYITMGDANTAQDKPIKSAQVVGVVKKIMPGFGIFRKTIFNPPVLIALIITLFIASTLFKKSNGINTKSKVEVYGINIFNKIVEKFKNKDSFKNLFKNINLSKNNKLFKKLTSNVSSIHNAIKQKVKIKEIIKPNHNLKGNVDDKDNLIKATNTIESDNNIEEKDIVPVEAITNCDEKETQVITENNDNVSNKNDNEEKDIAAIETITNSDEKETQVTAENNDNECVDENEVYREPDLEKTAIYRYITVDPNALKEINANKEVKANLDENAITLENVESKESSIESENTKSQNEELKENPSEEIKEDLDEESKIKLELEELNEKCGKKSKNIIEKVINIKKEEIKELIDVLENGEKEVVNETSIKNEILDVYANVRFYDNYIATSANKRFDTKAENTIKQLGNFLVNEYGGSDRKYNEKVAKYIDMFIAIADLEQTWNSKVDYKRKYQFYRKTLINYYKGEELSEKNIRYLINNILKIRKKYVGIVDYLLKKLESNTFLLKTNKLTNMKNTYGLELIHNISFNKMYSEYVIDKTYSDGIIAEDKIAVLITLLLVKITKDMLESNFDNKYILYVPNSLYDKERKLERLLKMFDNDYAKSHIKVLVTIKDFLDNRSLIKSFIKDGYRFSIVYDKEIKILYEDFGNLYIVDEIFIDKDAIDTKKLFAFIPEEIYSKFVDEDILKKVDSYGSE